MRDSNLSNLFRVMVSSGVWALAFVTMLMSAESLASAQSHDAENHPSSDTQPTTPSLRVVWFHSSTCAECYKVEKALPAIAKRWGDRIQIEKLNIHIVEDKEFFNELCLYQEHYNCPNNAPPVIFAGKQYLAGAKTIIARLSEVIAEELEKRSATFTPRKLDDKETEKNEQEEKTSGILERFRKFNVGTVIVAGLLDGINPCAFTTIIFLLSMLASLGKSRRQLAVVGIGFTVAVFVTYFLLGFGISRAIKSFSVSHSVPTAMAYGVAGITFILAGWSLIDFVRYVRTKDVKTVTLGLPKSIKSKIHKVIRVGLTTRSLIVGSITIGILVALLESLCTGQVYLPVIVIVSRTPGLRAAAIGYLLLYNLMFIVPLVVVLFIAYFGVKSERLGDFLRRHLAALKLALAILFAALGILVLATV